MSNLDMKKTLSHLYAPSTKTVGVVDVLPLNFLMIDGAGNPNTARAYVEAVEALYGLAYTIRFACKAAGEVYTVMPLEGLWTISGEPNTKLELSDADKDRFVWTMMIVQPESVTAEMVEQGREELRKKKSLTMLDEVRFDTYHEGESVQLMHIGPYADEGPNIRRLHQHIADNGWQMRGQHHEIYLSDPRRSAPDKMKTVIRQPFARG